MMSKEDAIELVKIMKRPLKSPSDYLKEVNLQSVDELEAVPSKTVELNAADNPEELDKAVSGTSASEVSKSSSNYVNPFQNGFKRFAPCHVKRLDNNETVNFSSGWSPERMQRIPEQGNCFQSFVSFFYFILLYYSLILG